MPAPFELLVVEVTDQGKRRPSRVARPYAPCTKSIVTDTASGLLPDAVARDIQALFLQKEEVAATGRECQTFIIGNGNGM